MKGSSCTGENSDSVPVLSVNGDHPELTEFMREHYGKSVNPPLRASRASRRGILAVPMSNGETLVLWVRIDRAHGSEQGERPRADVRAPAGKRTTGLGVQHEALLRLQSWKGVGRI